MRLRRLASERLSASRIELRCGGPIEAGIPVPAERRDRPPPCPGHGCRRLPVEGSSYRRVEVRAVRGLPVEGLIAVLLAAVPVARRATLSRWWIRPAGWHFPRRPFRPRPPRAPTGWVFDPATPPHPAHHPSGGACPGDQRRPARTRTKLAAGQRLLPGPDRKPAHGVRRPQGRVCPAYQPAAGHRRWAGLRR
jgi:hypothetical protein